MFTDPATVSLLIPLSLTPITMIILSTLITLTGSAVLPPPRGPGRLGHRARRSFRGNEIKNHTTMAEESGRVCECVFLRVGGAQKSVKRSRCW